jgi:hypothetical protein
VDNLSEEETEFIDELAKANAMKYKLLSEFWQNELLEMKTLRVLKYPAIWQATFYLLG